MFSQQQKLTRRRTIQAAGWSAPLILATSQIPSYAASSTSSNGLTASYGFFAQMINSNLANPFDTYAGVHSRRGAVSDSSANAQYANGRVTGSSGLAAHGEGSFTPGGTLGADRYGGLGFWASTPQKAGNGQALEGTTSVAAGSVFEVTYRFTFREAEAVTLPLGWQTGQEATYPAIADRPTSRLTHSNGAAFKARMLAPQTAGSRTWIGRVQIELLEDLVISQAGGDRNLGQILASHHAVYHDIARYLEKGEVTIAATDNVQLKLDVAGYETGTIPLGGQKASTSFNF